MTNSQIDTLPEDQISPKEILAKIVGLKETVKQNWKLILSMVLIGGIAGWIYDIYNYSKPRYQAYLIFNLESGQSGGAGGGLSDLASAFGLGGGSTEAGGLFTGQNFIELVRSRPMIERALLKEVILKKKKQLFINYYIQNSGMLEKEWEEDEKMKKIRFSKDKLRKDFTIDENIAMMAIVGKIVEETQFDKNNPKSSFTILKSDMQDEEMAKVWLETLIETVTETYKETTTKKTREILFSAKSRVDSLSRVMTGMDAALARYQDANMGMVAQQAMIVQQKMSRNSSLVGSMYYQAVQSLESIRFSLIRETPLVTIIDAPFLPLAKKVYPMYKSVKAGLIIGFVLALFFLFIRRAVLEIMKS